MIFVKEFTNTCNSGLDQQIIEFLTERKIKREDLIDIKYSFSVHNNFSYSSALVIYEKDLP